MIGGSWRKCWCGAAAAVFALIASGASIGRVVSESIPHQPNFLGKYICLGIEAPADKRDWQAPEIRSSIKIGSDGSQHEIVFGRRDRISINEWSVPKESCAGLPIGVAKWGNTPYTEFCLKSWRGDHMIKVSFHEEHSSSANEHYLKGSIYAVGACVIGTGDRFFQYGEMLKVESIPVYGP
jgi:hypothetical protein